MRRLASLTRNLGGAGGRAGEVRDPIWDGTNRPPACARVGRSPTASGACKLECADLPRGGGSSTDFERAAWGHGGEPIGPGEFPGASTEFPIAPIDGFQPIALLGEFLTFVGDVPVAMTYDARYSLQGLGAVYSGTSFGFEPYHKLGIELGHHLGRDPEGERLFEAASLAARYRATAKWELELSQEISLIDNRGLGNDFVIRRIGHDFVTEVRVNYRAGEGSSLGITVIPKLTYKPNALGLIERWLGYNR